MLESEFICFRPDEMPALEPEVTLHQFYPGQVLFYAEHFPYGLFILSKGEVEITYLNGVTKKLTVPALLGSSAFFYQTTYCATVKTLTFSQIYFLSKYAYQELASESSPFIIWLQELMGSSLSRQKLTYG